MIKGMVTAADKNRAVILKTDGTFAEIKNRNYSVGQRIAVSERSYVKYSAIAASLIIFITGAFSGYKLTYTPSSYIYIDINPSIRIDVNAFDRVISVNPLNSDAVELIEASQVKDKDINICINNIINACKDAEYINENNTDIEIDIMSKHIAVSQSVNNVSSKYDGALQFSVHNVSEAESRQAYNMGVSVSKLGAIKKYTEVFGGELSENTVKLKNVSKQKINAEIENKTKDKNYIPQDTEVLKKQEKKTAGTTEKQEQKIQHDIKTEKPQDTSSNSPENETDKNTVPQKKPSAEIKPKEQNKEMQTEKKEQKQAEADLRKDEQAERKEQKDAIKQQKANEKAKK